MKKQISLIGILFWIGAHSVLSAQTWSSVGSGTDSAVFALTTQNNSLFAGGQFTFAGGVTTPSIASWNGSSWLDVGGGISNFNGNNVQALHTYNNELYVGGFFGGASQSILKWTGTNWSPLGTGINAGTVKTITSYNGNIFAGGIFQSAGGSPINHVAQWNGLNWSILGSGLSYGPTSLSNTGGIYASVVYNGELYVAGDFIFSGNTVTNFIAKWNGTSWSLPGSGVNNEIWSLCVYNGELYAAGWFTQAGGAPASGIAKWNGAIWSGVGTGISGTPSCMAVYNNELYVGGTITNAGGITINRIAKWNGSVWSAVGTGTNGQIKSLATYNGDLYAGGFFTTAGGSSAKYIAKWSSPCTPPAATITPTGPTSFCAGSSITLNANLGSGITYQWYKNGVAQTGATSSSYLIGNAGTYYVVETSSCGTATSNSVMVNQINNPNPVVTYTTPTTFCSPGNILFTANTFAGVTYQWQKNSIDIAGATAQTYLATTNGKYRVKETANGCTKQNSDVQVSTATSVTATIAANGPVTFCTGGSVGLSVSNAIPGYGYQWKNNGVNIAGATTSSYTATTAGSYTCTVSATCGNATSNAIVVSTGGIVALVNPNGTVNICNGATVAFSANTGSGYAYQWKKNGTNISGATSANYSATTAGSYTVAITSPCGNATSAATTVAITALAANITPTGTTTICNGSAATFTANTGYNYTYQWYRAGLAIAGATASTHANSTAGNYTVVITQGGVCSATSNIAILAVTNNPNPSVTAGGPTTFCVGQSVTLTANTFAGVSYQWIKGSTNIARATNQSYTATTAGQYSVKETANGCTKQLGVPIVVTVNCKLGNEVIGVNGDLGIKVIPNPFTNEFEVRGLELEVGDKLQMANVLGEIVLKETVRNATSNIKLQTSNFPSGIYFLQITTASEKKTVKVVKQ